MSASFRDYVPDPLAQILGKRLELLALTQGDEPVHGPEATPVDPLRLEKGHEGADRLGRNRLVR